VLKSAAMSLKYRRPSLSNLHSIVLGALILAGCGDGVSTPVKDAKEAGHEACDRYIDCALEASPQAIAPILLSYGPEGECWKTSDLQVLDICKRACDAGREALEPLAPDFGACGECTEDLHCDDSDQPRCETDENVCVECISDGDCNGELCHPDEHTCVACVGDADCPGGACDPESFACVGCLTDEHCGAGVCDVEVMQCVGCQITPDCSEGVCNTETQTCVGCLVETDCGSWVEDCIDQQCVEHDTICEPGERRCVDSDNLEQCSADGLEWQSDGECGGDRVCEDGNCVDPVICPDGATDCSFADGDVAVYLCYDGGTEIKKDQDCDAQGKTCDAGKCVSTSYGPCTGAADPCADANDVCTLGAQGDYYCADEATCVKSTDCPAPFPDGAPGLPECDAGTCRLRCENSECPLGMTCRADVPGIGVCVWKY
jgi:hypothetical protein